MCKKELKHKKSRKINKGSGSLLDNLLKLPFFIDRHPSSGTWQRESVGKVIVQSPEPPTSAVAQKNELRAEQVDRESGRNGVGEGRGRVVLWQQEKRKEMQEKIGRNKEWWRETVKEKEREGGRWRQTALFTVD